MAKKNTVYDVFLTHHVDDLQAAEEVAKVLFAMELVVFLDTEQLDLGDKEDVLWEAMAESHSVVVILPSTADFSKLAFEVGAAKAWNKPIYLVATSFDHSQIPNALRDLPVFPLSRVDEIAAQIKRSMSSLSPQDIDNLVEVFSSISTTVDNLVFQPQELSKLVRQFNKSSGRKLSGEQVLSQLLRLRKSGKFPSVRKQPKP